MEHLFRTLHGQKTQWKVRKRLIASKSSDVWWNAETGQFPQSFTDLVQICSDKTEASLKFNTVFAYPVHAVWMNATKRRGSYLIEDGYHLLGFLPAGVARLEA